MKVVIEINEEIYNDALDGKFNVTAFNKAVRKHSTPLPKGHGRLIDADALGKELHRYTEAPYSYALSRFEAAPTIIEADKCQDDCEHCDWVTCPLDEDKESK